MGSDSEAEVGALFHNFHEVGPNRTTFHEMGHTQLATPIQTENSTSKGIVNNTVRQKLSKAMDMRFYWIQY